MPTASKKKKTAKKKKASKASSLKPSHGNYTPESNDDVENDGDVKSQDEKEIDASVKSDDEIENDGGEPSSSPPFHDSHGSPSYTQGFDDEDDVKRHSEIGASVKSEHEREKDGGEPNPSPPFQDSHGDPSDNQVDDEDDVKRYTEIDAGVKSDDERENDVDDSSSPPFQDSHSDPSHNQVVDEENGVKRHTVVDAGVKSDNEKENYCGVPCSSPPLQDSHGDPSANQVVDEEDDVKRHGPLVPEKQFSPEISPEKVEQTFHSPYGPPFVTGNQSQEEKEEKFYTPFVGSFVSESNSFEVSHEEKDNFFDVSHEEKEDKFYTPSFGSFDSVTRNSEILQNEMDNECTDGAHELNTNGAQESSHGKIFKLHDDFKELREHSFSNNGKTDNGNGKDITLNSTTSESLPHLYSADPNVPLPQQMTASIKNLNELHDWHSFVDNSNTINSDLENENKQEIARDPVADIVTHRDSDKPYLPIIGETLSDQTSDTFQPMGDCEFVMETDPVNDSSKHEFLLVGSDICQTETVSVNTLVDSNVVVLEVKENDLLSPLGEIAVVVQPQVDSSSEGKNRKTTGDEIVVACSNEIKEDTSLLPSNASSVKFDNDMKSELPYTLSENQPLLSSRPPTTKTSHWKSCCGLLDLITGSDR